MRIDYDALTIKIDHTIRKSGKFCPNLIKSGRILCKKPSNVKATRTERKSLPESASTLKNNSKGFWSLLKDKKSTFNPSYIIDPVDKTTLVDNKGKIELCVKDHFSNIGKDFSVESPHRASVADFLEKVATDNVSDQNMFTLPVNRSTVNRIVHELKSGKAMGTDEVPNEFLKFGGKTIVNTLIDLFVAICDLESIPSEWQKGIIIPIHKSGSVYNIDNYRGITLTSNVYKVFAKVLESNIMTFLENNNVLGENQGAFRRDRRIEDHLFTLNGVCASRKAAKLKTYVAFLDLSKAFDRVWRDGLFYSLWKNGIQGKVWRILKQLYGNVSNKVIFGEFETEWFEQEHGVKQGCVLSPALFSVLMKDLVDMLKEHNLGVSFASQIINALLYADDVALLAESEVQLQQMLNVASDFASKWNLKFNASKSKVLVIGKRTDKNKLWYIGHTSIEEADTYKYLGVYFSRNLKSSYHINTYVKSNIENKLNGMIQILGRHGHFNRIGFGTALWESVIKPTISHACAVWLQSSTAQSDFIESLQYRAAKIVMRIKLNIPKCALFTELGWEPINAFLDRQRVSYFARFAKLPHTRWCKIVLSHLFGQSVTEWPYMGHIRSLFEESGLDHFFEGNVNINTFNKFFGQNVKFKQMELIASKSSLKSYLFFHKVSGPQKYLNNIDDFEASRLKLLARTDCLPLNSVLKRMSMINSDICDLCSSDVDDVSHFLVDCPALQSIRNEYFSEISIVFSDFIELPSIDKVNLLIGDYGYFINDECGNYFDIKGKNMLKSMFLLRNQLLEV